MKHYRYSHTILSTIWLRLMRDACTGHMQYNMGNVGLVLELCTLYLAPTLYSHFCSNVEFSSFGYICLYIYLSQY